MLVNQAYAAHAHQSTASTRMPLEEAAPGRVVGDQRCHLGDREDEDEIEEELERLDPLVGVRADRRRDARCSHRRNLAWRRVAARVVAAVCRIVERWPQTPRRPHRRRPSRAPQRPPVDAPCTRDRPRPAGGDEGGGLDPAAARDAHAAARPRRSARASGALVRLGLRPLQGTCPGDCPRRGGGARDRGARPRRRRPPVPPHPRAAARAAGRRPRRLRRRGRDRPRAR